MDILNSGISENPMLPGEQSPNAPEPDGCCVSNNYAANHYDWNTPIDNAQNLSSSDDSLHTCASTDDITQTSKMGHCLPESVSANDTLNTQEACDLLAVCTTQSNLSDAQKDGDCHLSCVSPNTSVSDDLHYACTSENDIPSTPNEDNCISPGVSVNEDKDTDNTSNEPKTKEYLGVTLLDCETPYSSKEKQIGEILSGYISASDTPNAEKIDDDVVRIVTELAKLGFTRRELNGNELMPMNTELIHLKERGLFTRDIKSMIRMRVNKFYTEEVDYHEYKIYFTIFDDFKCIEDSTNDVNEDDFFVKYKNKMKLLKEDNKLSEERICEFQMIEKKREEIQKRFAQLKAINVPGMVGALKSIEEIGILSEVLILKMKVIAMACSQLSRLIVEQQDRMQDSWRKIKKETDEGKTVIVCYRQREPKQQSKKYQEKQPDSRICRSEHNTPFCVKCGWRTSWVKAFKKRGIFIKEDTAGGNNKCIWVNSINES